MPVAGNHWKKTVRYVAIATNARILISRETFRLCLGQKRGNKFANQKNWKNLRSSKNRRIFTYKCGKKLNEQRNWLFKCVNLSISEKRARDIFVMQRPKKSSSKAMYKIAIIPLMKLLQKRKVSKILILLWKHKDIFFAIAIVLRFCNQ